LNIYLFLIEYLFLIHFKTKPPLFSSKVPAGSFIAMDDFPGPKAMAAHLNGLIANETAYLEHHAWRWQFPPSDGSTPPPTAATAEIMAVPRKKIYKSIN
jgi:hypothetical protein